MKLQHLCTFIALSSTHAPLLQDRHDRSVALRSDKVMLSLSSSLQGHSDFPTSITVPYGVYPAPGLSQLYPSGVSLRGCTIRFMLQPAALAGIPDWVKPMPLIQWAKAVSTPCRGKFSPCVTARTRPQPAYPKGQLI